jgi:hypothetical protein
LAGGFGLGLTTLAAAGLGEDFFVGLDVVGCFDGPAPSFPATEGLGAILKVIKTARVGNLA